MNDRMRILVTGANGFVGHALVARLAEAGWIVRGAVRRPLAAMAGLSEQATVGEIDASTDWSEALSEVDVVVHVAGRAHVLNDKAADPLQAFRMVNRDATLRLASQAKDTGVRRFVFISTIGVNRSETRGIPLTAADTPSPHSPYAQSKWEAEMEIREITADGSMDHVIIRPPLVIGPDPKGNLGTLLRVLRSGIPLPLGSITRNRRDLVSLDTLNDLVTTVVDARQAANQTFLVSDGQALSTYEIVERLAQIHGLSARLVPFPPQLLAAGLGLIGKSSLASQLCGDLEIDIAHTCATLNWAPPTLH